MSTMVKGSAIREHAEVKPAAPRPVSSKAASPTTAALPSAANFAVACASGISGWLIVHPADVVKVRMQLLGPAAVAGKASEASMLDIGRSIYRLEGMRGLYSGLSAAIARQMTYTTLRLGFFDEIKQRLARAGIQESAVTRSLAGMSAGAAAAFLACPVEVCLVRMQADGKLPVSEQRGYRHVGDALLRVGREEGLTAYWRGAAPTVLRAMVVSTTQLGTYDQAKVTYKSALGMQEGTPLHLAASLTAGFVYSLASLPLDTAKTRMQTQPSASASAPLLYTSTLQTLGKIVKEEGVLRLWKGFSAYFVRGGGHTVAMFLFYEQYKSAARRFWLPNDN